MHLISDFEFCTFHRCFCSDFLLFFILLFISPPPPTFDARCFDDPPTLNSNTHRRLLCWLWFIGPLNPSLIPIPMWPPPLISQGTHQHRAAGAIHSGRWSVTEHGGIQAAHVALVAPRITVPGANELARAHYEGKRSMNGEVSLYRKELFLVLYIHNHMDTLCGTNIESLSDGLVGSTDCSLWWKILWWGVVWIYWRSPERTRLVVIVFFIDGVMDDDVSTRVNFWLIPLVGDLDIYILLNSARSLFIRMCGKFAMLY